MRDNLYMTAILICACLMLLAGLAFTGLEILQYTRGPQEPGPAPAQEKEVSPQPEPSEPSPTTDASSESEESSSPAEPGQE
jgi:hypothetical protein